MYIISIALNIPLKIQYQYSSEKNLALGSRVLVQLKNKLVLGVVVDIQKYSSETNLDIAKLKAILDVGDDCYNLNQEMIDLVEFVSRYYHYPLGQTIFTALPKKIKDPALLKYDEKFFKHKSPKTKYSSNDSNIELNSEQQIAIKHVCQQPESFDVFLLHGITGSGKTEVYLHSIAYYLSLGKQILVMIPEINLTPQLLHRFEVKFSQEKIFTLNSEVSDLTRLKTWLLAKTGVAKIIISTRLGVFTPFSDLGLIIIDEEHDKSFKQNDHLRYHARDVAIWRAQYNKIPILLGSATPSIESFYNVQQERYKLLSLSSRAVVGAGLAQIKLIDTTQNPINDSGLSFPALQQIEECISQGDMCLVFINKRGYAPVLNCNCGWSPYCKNCSTTMVCHLTVLKCHHCLFTQNIPERCPKCHQDYLYTVGYGTQKVESFLSDYCAAKGITSKILRVDRDTTTSKKSWDDIYNKIHAKEVNILIGTQMLAKGHDFPNITLVVVIDSDYLLYSSNFRAHEELFATTVQIAGRSGRGVKNGQVLIQTAVPNHQIYKSIVKQDYFDFAKLELVERTNYSLPPFSYYAIIRIHAYNKQKLFDLLKQINELLHKQKLPEQLEITKALPCHMLKLNKQYRGSSLIMAGNRKVLHQYLHKIESGLAKINTNIIIDVDPIEI